VRRHGAADLATKTQAHDSSLPGPGLAVGAVQRIASGLPLVKDGRPMVPVVSSGAVCTLVIA
jgi:hypothetical protein